MHRRDHLTFKGNLEHTRYGWLRLTPAYSVHLVEGLLEAWAEDGAAVLDPFCGTGTTALVCAERGIACDTTDINPFLIWLSRAKARSYDHDELDAFASVAREVARSARTAGELPPWIPPLHQIEKWWDAPTLHALGRSIRAINAAKGAVPDGAVDLLKLAFCRTMIERANVSFGHQSMSFKKGRLVQASFSSAEELVATVWEQSVALIAGAARTPILREPRVLLCDARHLSEQLPANHYTCVITSPPYPNRMSYIRELRPYMYWLGYLSNGRDAGELDWQAIGGTWGCATSNLTRWEPETGVDIPFPGFPALVNAIVGRSPLLARYVHKYFHDMVIHCRELFQVVKPGGVVSYIVGNAKFYDILVPTEAIFAALFEAAGFTDVTVQAIRKRTSKRELFEFIVVGRKPDEWQG